MERWRREMSSFPFMMWTSRRTRNARAMKERRRKRWKRKRSDGSRVDAVAVVTNYWVKVARTRLACVSCLSDRHRLWHAGHAAAGAQFATQVAICVDWWPLTQTGRLNFTRVISRNWKMERKRYDPGISPLVSNPNLFVAFIVPYLRIWLPFMPSV